MSHKEDRIYEPAPYDALAQNYDQGLEQLLGIWGKDNEKFAEYKIQFLNIQINQKIDRILDFGCGTGRSLGYFSQYFSGKNSEHPVIAGCDISAESIKIAKQNNPTADIFLCTNVEQLCTHQKEYDLIFLSCVLHHMQHDIRDEWIKTLTEKLSYNGIIAIFEHNLFNPYTKYIVNKPENEEDIEELMLTKAEVASLLEAVGMTIVFSGYTLFSPVRRPWITHVESYLSWLPLGAQHCTIGRKKI